MMQFLVLSLLLFSAAVSASSQHVRYVKSDHPPSSCPGQPCLTLNQYISQAETYFTTGSTFLFLAGNHSVSSTLLLKDVSRILFKGYNNYSVTIALYKVIQCEKVSKFAVENLKFINFIHTNSINRPPIQDISLLTFHESKKIKLTKLTFQGRSDLTPPSAVRAVKIRRSNVVITDSQFSGNIALDGGALYVSDRSSITIDNCLFRENTASPFNDEKNEHEGGALHVLQGCHVTIAHSIFERNTAQCGGALYAEEGNTITIFRCIFQENTAIFNGGALAALSSNITITSCHFQLSNSPIMKGVGAATIFSNNSAEWDGGAIFISDSTFTITTSDDGSEAASGKCSNLESFTFSDNHAPRGGAIYLAEGRFEYKADSSDTSFEITGNTGSAIDADQSNASFSGDMYIGMNSGDTGGGIRAAVSSISFTGTTVFEENHASEDGGAFWMQQSTISFDGYTQIKNNSATGNGGAGFTTDSGSVVIRDDITFSTNTATKGGALFFQNGATIKLNERAAFHTKHNHASEYGGAIYHSDSVVPAQCEFAMSDEIHHDVKSVAKLPLCFLQLQELYESAPVQAVNNTAIQAGSFLYGGLLDKCKTYDTMDGKWTLLYPKLDIKRDGTISSQVYELCFCQTMHQYNCSTTKNISTHRGRRFTVSLLALAQGDTSSSATVRAKLTSARLHPNQLLQDIPDNCTELSYNLYSANEMEQLVLYPDGGPCSDIGMARATINVKFLPCPDAFTLSGDQCVCEERLQPYHVECNISEDSTFIERKAGSRVWMSAVYSNGTYQGLVLYPTCPMGYCRNNTVAVSLLNPDLQCDHNRSGVLCGACATKHSLMLGTSGCKVCSNAYLSLILSFAAAGIVLVVFLTLLRLTVATGMINSVIFYANIVQANKDILFFSNSTNSVLTVFIAWMNLDLGLHTCFYDGMDAYAQTWLQFAFPVYVWILMSFIILASRYSVTVTKLIGSNPIAVLATLLLMSYTKLIKIVIEVYSSVDMEYPDNRTATVWLKDANEPYLQSRHLALTVVTTLLLVFLFLPYTLLLLLGYKLYRFTGRRHTRWLMRIKPLLDAYYAPYQMHTRYWTGFLLLVRCALYIVFSYNSLGHTTLSLVAIIITFAVIIVWLSIRVYSKLLVNTTEAVVYLNLIALSTSALAEVDSPALLDSLVGIVLVIMMGIIIYHFHIFYIAKSALWLKLRGKMRAEQPAEPIPLLAPEDNERVPVAIALPPQREPTRSVLDMNELLQANNE